MASIVLELQREALARDVPVPDVLRKALVVARKLALRDFETWINHELHGYPPDAEIPPYRIMRGEIRGLDPYRGWLPIQFESPQQNERLSRRPLHQAIGEVQSLADQPLGGDLVMSFPPEGERALQRAIRDNVPVKSFVSPASLAGVLSAVRTKVVEWTLSLEEQGVKGEELSFTDAEKQAAAQASNITNVFLGAVHSQQIQHASPHATQIIATNPLDLEELRAFVEALKSQLGGMPVDAPQRAELDAELATVEAQLRSPSPKNTILRESLLTVRRVLEGAVSSAAGDLLTRFATLFG
jgi:hypothetical protein